ncbi:MAG: RHS repeat-associated core domain-containing protein [Desulfitobacteriaceae bacterium]
MFLSKRRKMFSRFIAVLLVMSVTSMGFPGMLFAAGQNELTAKNNATTLSSRVKTNETNNNNNNNEAFSPLASMLKEKIKQNKFDQSNLIFADNDKKNTTKDYPIKNKGGLYSAGFSSKAGKKFLKFTKDNSSLSLNPLNPSTVTAKVYQNSVIFEDIYPNTDIRYVAEQYFLKEDIIVKKYTGTNEFSFQFNLDNAVSQIKANGEISFLDSVTKKTLFHLAKPYAIDNKGNRCENITQIINKQGLIQLSIDSDWLKKAEYPVIIDPTIFLEGETYDNGFDFSGTQGGGNWYYDEQLPNGTIQPMTWNQNNKKWVGSDGISYINGRAVYPGTNNAVVTWKAPHSGVVLYNDHVFNWGYGGSGDGINFKIMKNNTQIWPASGWKNLADTFFNSTSYTKIISVNADDIIQLIVNKNVNSINDNNFVSALSIMYTDDYYLGSTNFSSTQGQNNWYYEERKSDGKFYPMTWDAANNRWQGTGGNYVGSNWQLPGTNDSVRTWKAPYSGIVSVDGLFNRLDTSGGDGVSIYIYHNSNLVLGQSFNLNYNNTSGISYGPNIPVNAGDCIRFIVKQKTNNTLDKTGVDPTIGYYQLHNTSGIQPYWNYFTKDLGGGWNAAINTFNENLVLNKQLFSIPGCGYSIGEQITFNSTDKRGGPLGAGWHLGSDISLIERSDDNVVLNNGEGSINIFTPDGSGGYIAPPGLYLTLQKLGSGNYTITDKKRNILTFQNNRIAQMSDANGNVTTYFYTNGQLTKVTDASGRSITYDYNTDNKISAIHDPAGNTYKFGYLSSNYDYISTITDPQNKVVKLEFNIPGYPGTYFLTDPLNKVTKFYALNGEQVDRIKDAGSNETVLTQTIQGNEIVTSITDPGNHTLTCCHDPNTGEVTSIKDSLNNTTNYTYDASYNLISQTDPLGRVTNSSYDANGNTISVTDPLNHITGYNYDSNNNLLSTTDALGHVTSYSYDTKGNMLSDGNNTYTYNTNGTIATTIDAKGNTTSNTYDSYGNVTKIIDAAGKATLYTYDTIGNKLTETDAGGNTTSYTYDKLGRLLTVTVPDGAGSTKTTSYIYDANGNRLTLTDAAGNVTTWTYDALNRITSTTEPGNRTKSITYNAAGNVASETAFDGTVTTYGYDASNRLTQVNYSDGRVVSYSYDAAGNKTGMTDASGTTAYQYDANNNLVRETGPTGRIITYTYDAVNKLTGKSINGSTVTFNYDNNNNLIGLVDSNNLTTGFSYDLNKNRTATNYAGGAKINYSYDTTNRLTNINNLGPSNNILSSFAYTYYDNSQIHNVTDSNGLTAYEYDGQNRLTKITDPVGNTTAYTFDSVGNRISLVNTVGGVTSTTSYTYDTLTNQLTSVTNPDGSTVSYTYDTKGNTLRKVDSTGTTGYAYNSNNQLTQVTKPNGDVIQFTYDGDNRRISKNVNGVVTKYQYDGDLIAAETDASGSVLAAYVYDNDGVPVSVTKGGQTYNYHYNGHGDVVSLTNSSGNVVTTYEYDVWGKVTAKTGTVDTPFGYAGQYGYVFDKETGLYFLKSRYYDPEICRFTSRDRFKGFENRPASQNPYTYCENDPISGIDSDGNCNRLKHAILGISFVLDGVYQLGKYSWRIAVLYNAIRISLVTGQYWAVLSSLTFIVVYTVKYIGKAGSGYIITLAGAWQIYQAIYNNHSGSGITPPRSTLIKWSKKIFGI